MPRSRAVLFSQLLYNFYGQEQLCPLTCEGRRDLSDYTRMSTIQSRKLEKRPKKPCNTDLKISMKSLLHYPPTFLSTDSKMMKGFSETLPTKIKPTKCPASWKKNEARKAKIEGRRESEKWKSKVSKMSKFCFLRMPELCKRLFCTWLKRPRSVQPLNGFVGRFSS